MNVIRPLEWAFSWLSERPVVKAEAHVCTMPHIAFWVGPSGEIPHWDPHIDVAIHLHKQRGGKVSVYELTSSTAAGQTLEPISGWTAVELEGGGVPVDVTIPLLPPAGEPLKASIGDRVEIALRATHRNQPIRVSVPIVR